MKTLLLEKTLKIIDMIFFAIFCLYTVGVNTSIDLLLGNWGPEKDVREKEIYPAVTSDESVG